MAQDRTPPALDEVEELDDYWTENTTISVQRITKQRLDEHRDGRNWDVFLEQLRREHADPITYNDVSDIADELKNQLSMVNEPTVDHDVEGLIERVEALEEAVKETTNALQRQQRVLEALE